MVKYNVTGSKRKKLVQKLSALTAQKPEYLGLPSMAFKVGPYIVTKNGTIEGDVPEDIIKALARGGFKGEVEESPFNTKEDKGFIISVPMDELTDTAVDNFYNMVGSKESLIKKAFKLSSLPVDYGDEALAIRWFENKKLPDETISYIRTFVSAMLDKARTQKYVIPRPVKSDNPKYNFRVFLNYLGLSGNAYKPLRKELLKDLKGSSSLRHPDDRKPSKKILA